MEYGRAVIWLAERTPIVGMKCAAGAARQSATETSQAAVLWIFNLHDLMKSRKFNS